MNTPPWDPIRAAGKGDCAQINYDVDAFAAEFAAVCERFEYRNSNLEILHVSAFTRWMRRRINSDLVLHISHPGGVASDLCPQGSTLSATARVDGAASGLAVTLTTIDGRAAAAATPTVHEH